MTKKDRQIKRIKTIIANWGTTTSTELELDCSPCINSIGTGKQNVSQLIEHFNHNDVIAVTYHDEIELGEENISYEKLSRELIDEISGIMEVYEIDCQKAMKRSES